MNRAPVRALSGMENNRHSSFIFFVRPPVISGLMEIFFEPRVTLIAVDPTSSLKWFKRK